MELVNNYIKELFSKFSKGDSSEQSYYGILEAFLENYGKSIGKKTTVTANPKQIEAGNPDFRVWDGTTKVTGYVEAKNPIIVKNLDDIENTEQIKRYLEAFPNFILTNFIEFRLYRNGLLLNKPVVISDYLTHLKQVKSPSVYNTDDFCKLLNFFFNFITPSINSTKTLAEVLANKAGIMRDFIIKPILEKDKDNYFYWLYSSFKKHLIEDLKIEDFADLFSQTFTYGLFIAKYQFETQGTLFGKKVSELPFTTKTAYDYIQKSFGLLREIFKVISTQEMPKDLEIIVDDIVDILNHTDIYKILNQSSKNGKRDPIFHLYETFLLKYDKEKKKKLGIYYTPLEVVTYIVNSVNEILKDNNFFNASNGLATYETDSIRNPITLLDPAVGTGTFLIYAMQLAIEEAIKISDSKYYLNEFIKNHILKNFYAFEILIAPYVVSHLKVLFTLTDENYDFNSEDNVKIYLTNTLEFSQKILQGFPGFFEQTLVTEQKNAYEVKHNTPILIVVGNPPYSISSQNKIDTITEFGKFYESYKENVRIEEKNLLPLSDDYIKFLSFAHYKINQTGKGVIAMITNNSFLDGIIHRDMRKKLINDFDLIYILNLHGDMKRSKSSKELKDENVFDITQGVSINIFIKTEKIQDDKKFFYQDITGLKEDKYKFLDNHNIKNTEWIELKPFNPYYFFIPKNFLFSNNYNGFLSIKSIFKNYSIGVQTHRDNFIIDNNKIDLFNRLTLFFDERNNDSFISEKFNFKDTPDWNIKEDRKILLKEGLDQSLIKKYDYRIFDKRFIYYKNTLVTRLRQDFMNNLLYNNLSLVTTKILADSNFKHIFISDTVGDGCLISNKTKEGNYYFPLWIYEKNDKNKFNNLSFEVKETNRISNIKEVVIKAIENLYTRQIKETDIFNYIYAILYSKVYREKYNEFLKIDFPKIPFTKNYDLFVKLSKLGKYLIDLHLLKLKTINSSNIGFEGNEGDGIIENIQYDELNKKLRINKFQAFTNISFNVYNYYIGSYQVLYKWLKDKKGKSLKIEDINYFINIVKVIEETIKTQSEIDKIYPGIEKELITLN